MRAAASAVLLHMGGGHLGSRNTGGAEDGPGPARNKHPGGGTGESGDLLEFKFSARPGLKQALVKLRGNMRLLKAGWVPLRGGPSKNAECHASWRVGVRHLPEGGMASNAKAGFKTDLSDSKTHVPPSLLLFCTFSPALALGDPSYD